MAGYWRDDERHGMRGGRDRWPDEEWGRDRDREGRDQGMRNRGYGYGGRDEDRHRGDFGWYGSDAGYGSGYGPSRWGFGGGRTNYQDHERGYGRMGRTGSPGYGELGEDRGRSSDWRREGQGYPSSWGQDWGDEHGRHGYGGRSFGLGWSGEGSGQHGYGRDYGRGGQERGFWDRATDEVSSWFGDEQAEQRRRMDDMQSYKGRGPKGYMRSDDRIREDVSDALSDDPMVDASEVTVAVSNCEVTLTGTVDNRTAKRRAEDCAERISGVKHVQNNLRVQETAFGSTTTGTTAGKTAGTVTSGSTTGGSGASGLASSTMPGASRERT